MDALKGDSFYPVCIICTAADAPTARQGAWEFHKQDSPRFKDTVDMMQSIGVSPTGSAPATHFICTRHDTLEALGRIETYQKALEHAGKPRVPVTLYIGKSPLVMAAGLPGQLADHEKPVLDSFKPPLRRTA